MPSAELTSSAIRQTIKGLNISNNAFSPKRDRLWHLLCAIESREFGLDHGRDCYVCSKWPDLIFVAARVQHPIQSSQKCQEENNAIG